MAGQPLSDEVLRKAYRLAKDGMTLTEVAKAVGVSRSALYLYGIRSARGYRRG